MLKGRKSPLSNSRSVQVTKNVIDFWFRKLNSICRFPSDIKSDTSQRLPIDPVFSNWDILSKPVNHKLFWKFKELNGHLFSNFKS